MKIVRMVTAGPYQWQEEEFCCLLLGTRQNSATSVLWSFPSYSWFPSWKSISHLGTVVSTVAMAGHPALNLLFDDGNSFCFMRQGCTL